MTIRAGVAEGGLLRSGQPMAVAAMPENLAGGELQLRWNSVPGERYHVEVSTNLQDWFFLQDLAAQEAITTLSVLSSGEERGFIEPQMPAP